MKYSFALIIITLFLTACNQAKNKNSVSTKENPQENSTSRLKKGCYGYQSKGDTISFEITETVPEVSGQLIYALSEKDKNTGQFKGMLRGDTLIGRYVFKAEGTTSVREIAFLVKKDSLWEGYGPIKNQGNEVIFSTMDSLTFNSSLPLTLGDCN